MKFKIEYDQIIKKTAWVEAPTRAEAVEATTYVPGVPKDAGDKALVRNVITSVTEVKAF